MKDRIKYVLATSNPGKIQEMREILSGLDIDFITREDLGINFEIEETGSTFRDNALIKAKAICEAAGLPAISDDSGLMVDALDGGPGVNSSSFGGEGLDNERRCAYLLEKLRGEEQRGAKFVCTIVCAFPDGRILTAEGECPGSIADSPRGSNGFGYDPVFFARGMNKTMAELPPEEKNRLSHRGKALRRFSELVSSEMKDPLVR